MNNEWDLSEHELKTVIFCEEFDSDVKVIRRSQKVSFNRLPHVHAS